MNKDKRQLSHSQNFLKNPKFVGILIDRTDIEKDDLVIEIGPGKGIITAELSKRAGKVIAIEYDANLVKSLKESFSNHPNVEIVEANFIHWKLPNHRYKVFSNIPFNMTADIVNKLLSAKKPPKTAYLIMQDKAAGRFMGPPYGPTSQTSVLLQPFYDMKIITKIDRKKFYPVPNVNVVLSKFKKREEVLINSKYQSLYKDFVVYGYNQWKPTLLEAFRGIFTEKQLNVIAQNLKLGGLKPSELTLDQWLKIFETFIKLVPQDKKNLIKGAEKKLRSKQKGMQKVFRTRKNSDRRKFPIKKLKRR